MKSCLSKSQPLLRTFYQTGPGLGRQVIQGLTYSNLKCLRVLDLRLTKIDTLHVSIRKLKHLRYLDLSNCDNIKSLPNESICSLRNLQVLKLNGCRNLQGLPENMREMTNLRHLGIRGCNALRRMPTGMGNLISLRELSMFVVVPESGRGMSELHGLDHLTGELTIKGLEHVRNLKDAKNANLLRKKNLCMLSLSWSEENNSSSIEEDEEIIASIGECLQPHSNLKQLSIKYYNGLRFPSWMSHSCLPNLVTIQIQGLRRCENLPSLGNLPLLESLMIGGMDSLKCIGSEFYGCDHDQGLFFPALKRLYIYEMPNLEDWSSPSKSNGGELEEVFPSLESFILLGCPKLRTLPRLPSSLKELTVWQCNNEVILERLLENVSPNSSCLSTLDIGGFDDEIIGERRWAKMLRKLACLQSLTIRSWLKMKILPKELLESLPTLTELSIEKCKELVSLPVEMQNLTSLTKLHIEGCEELVSMPVEMENLTSLESFEISWCGSLKSLPELGSRNNTVMKSLSIYYCDGLTSVSDCLRNLTTLDFLLINGCPELEFLQDDFQDLISLRSLSLSDLPQMTCLPEGLQKLAGTLETLKVYECSELEFLQDDFQDLASLRSLSLSDLPQMTCLPEGLQQVAGTLESLEISNCSGLTSLPEWMYKFTALKTLRIENCHPDLHRRYAKETGEDWHKIAHIPDLSNTRTLETITRKRSMKCKIIPCFSSSSSTN